MARTYRLLFSRVVDVSTAQEMSNELTLVPPGRLGALLSAARRESGVDIAALSARSGGVFTPSVLESVERGRHVLDDDAVAQLTGLYGIDDSQVIPERSRLILDLGSGNMSIGDTGFATGTGSGEVDEVLQRYLSLLYLMRNMQPGTELTLRDRDLEVLSETLEQSLKVLEMRLGELMLGRSGQVEKKKGLLGSKLLLPAAGLLVALTAVGSLVIVGGQSNNDAPVNDDAVAAQFETGGIATPGTAFQVQTPQGERLVIPGTGVVGEVESASEVVAEAEVQRVSFEQRDSTIEVVQGSDLTPVSDVVAVSETAVTDWAAMGAEAEALISYDWQTVLDGWTVSYEGDAPGYRGMTHTQSKTITIYLDAGDTSHDVAGILAHEIGHAIDVVHMTDDARAQWLEARGMPRAWWPGNGLSDFHVGAGDFAEGVASLISGSPSDSAYGEFTPDQMALLQSFLPGGMNV